jgi:hypothetical protein
MDKTYIRVSGCMPLSFSADVHSCLLVWMYAEGPSDVR